MAAAAAALFGGSDAALSAGIAVVVVFANFVFFAVSVAYAARISPTLLYAVGLGGFLVRMAVLAVLLLALTQLAWFMVGAFVAAFVVCTVVLLSVEIKMIAGRMQADLWNLPEGQGAAPVIGLLAEFHPPTTKDFVWGCWGPSLDIGPLSFCMDFINFLVLFGLVLFIAFFYFGLRRTKVVPSKLQSLSEMGIQFVRENIAFPMLGADSDRFLPLLATFFFAIFFWNIFEVVPGINFSSNSRIAFPLTMALVAWVTYNAVGISKHGFFGYLKHVCVPPGAPAALYVLLIPIEFITQILIRPITLSVRLWANFMAGHFLLAVFFLGTIAMLQGGFTVIFAPFSFAIGIALVGFEIFVSGLQAFIFAILTASYIGGAMAEEH